MTITRSRYLYASLFAATVVALPSTSFAQMRSSINPGAIARGAYADDRLLSHNDIRRSAYDVGYREGLKEGERDARRGERYGFEDEREFRNGDRGYNRRFGDRERYRQSFRSGYAAGYNDAYRRNAGYYPGNGPYRSNRGYGGYGDWRNGGSGVYGPRGYGYYSPAFDNGARDGYEKGREDVRKNRSFDPLRHSWYRSGDRHYEREYGSRDEYKNVYRRGFQQGYERAFSEGRYYRW